MPLPLLFIAVAAATGLVGVGKSIKAAVDTHDANKTKIWALKDMDADHVLAWSKGGETTIENCQMLCKHHNRSKGNA